MKSEKQKTTRAKTAKTDETPREKKNHYNQKTGMYSLRLLIPDYEWSLTPPIDPTTGRPRQTIASMLYKKKLSVDEVSVVLYELNAIANRYHFQERKDGEIYSHNRKPDDSRPEAIERFERIQKAFKELKRHPDYIYHYLGATYLEDWNSIPVPLFDRVIAGCQTEINNNAKDQSKDGAKAEAVCDAVFWIVCLWKSIGLPLATARNSILHKTIVITMDQILDSRSDYYTVLKQVVKQAGLYTIPRLDVAAKLRIIKTCMRLPDGLPIT